MVRDSKLVRGLLDWLLGGLSTRLDFVERDVDTLQRDTRQIHKDQKKIAQVVLAHHAQLQHNTAQMIELRRMHGLLANRLGEAFPGQHCKSCGSALIFERQADQKAYSLQCPKRCGDRLFLPEAKLLSALKKNSLLPQA